MYDLIATTSQHWRCMPFVLRYPADMVPHDTALELLICSAVLH